jgi:CO dehydrogenase maturation factor
MRLAVAGKGGAGKSVIAGTIARVLARRGHRVLALDSDPMPGLALSLGAAQPAEPPLNEAAERPEGGRWRLKRGIGPVRAVRRYSTPAPDGVRLLQIGKTSAPDGLAGVMASIQAFYAVIHRLDRPKTLRAWTIVGDLPAGPRQTAFDWAPYAETLLVVVEGTWKGALTARRIARIARSRPDVEALLVANKVAGKDDVRVVEGVAGERVFASIPADEDVVEAERLGVAPIDHSPSSAAVRAIERLAERLERR